MEDKHHWIIRMYSLQESRSRTFMTDEKKTKKGAIIFAKEKFPDHILQETYCAVGLGHAQKLLTGMNFNR